MSCTCVNGHNRFGWRRSGFLLIILGIFLFAAILLPYITVVARRLLPAFLPFISQSGGAPPQSGMLSIPLIFLSFTGFIAFGLYFVSINHRNSFDSIWVRRFNYMAFPVAVTCFLGCIVTAAFPVAYTELPNQLEWIVTVLVEHGTGATMVLAGIVVYQMLMTVVWWFLPDVARTVKFIKVGFCFVYLAIFAIVFQPTFTFIYEELGHKRFNAEELRNVTSFDLPRVFSPSYKILAVFEWIVCSLSMINVLTAYKDFQRISVCITLRHKYCLMHAPEPTVLPLKTLC